MVFYMEENLRRPTVIDSLDARLFAFRQEANLCKVLKCRAKKTCAYEAHMSHLRPYYPYILSMLANSTYSHRFIVGKAATLSGLSLMILFMVSITTPVAHGQSLEELKQSEIYRKLDLDAPVAPIKKSKKKARPEEVLTNYDSLWRTSQGAKLLLQWSDARIPNHRLEINSTTSRRDCAQVSVNFQNREGIEITAIIQVPKPTYKAMAEHRTLESFNRFRPPALDASGSQKVTFHGIESDYFRHRSGSCSILIPISQAGIINLFVPSCTQSQAMFEVAKLLNVSRLNEKLTS